MSNRAMVAAVVTTLAIFGLAGPAQASNQPIAIDFEKDCPEFTCEETSGSPVDVSTVLTVESFAGGVLHYTAAETVSSAAGSLTMRLVGMLNLNADPDLTIVHGTVERGSWNGVELSGANLHVSAVRVGGSVFRGTITVLPGSTG